MSRPDRDRSYDDPRLPQGAVMLAILLILLAAGVFLIVRGLGSGS